MPEEQNDKIVCIVEDDAFLVKAYQYIFEHHNIRVQVSRTGEEALAYFKIETPNVVLLDINLPGISGFEVLEAMSKDEKLDHVPVIILSNLGSPEDINRGKELGAVEYLVKANIDIDGILERVNKYLR